MFSARLRLSRLLITGVVALTGLAVVPPAPARAETSYHKLKVHLREAERDAGEVGEAAAVGVFVGILEVCLGGEDVDFPTVQPAKASNATPAPAAPAHPISHMRPPESEYPRRK
jgi:hypothetical protein